jgi:general secretion pathway protein C
MELILKKYFWVVNLLVIGICAGFAGRAAGHFVEGAYLAGDDAKSPVRRFTPPPMPPKVHGKEGDLIISRNIFCSGCAPIKPVDKGPGGEGPTDNTPQKTSLQLELVSTMVCPDDDNWSMAIIRDLSTQQKDPGMFAKGAIVGESKAEVLKVLSKRVYIKNGGRTEYLELDGAAPLVASNTPAPPVPPPVMPGAGGEGDIPDNAVKCSGNSCTVERALVEKLLSNTAMLATSARFVPSIKDGKPNGFKLYAIRPQSIFGRIGLQNGDTIKAINGSDMSTPDAALALYTKLRNASHLSVQVERRGETVTLDYSIR